MCAEMFDVPVALVSLVDERRQWFKARVNFDGTQTGRAESFCAWTALCIERKVLVVRDATVDEKFKDNPLVTGDPGVRFYAGAPLVVDDVVLGALCLIDFEPHEDEGFFDEDAARRLRAVARPSPRTSRGRASARGSAPLSTPCARACCCSSTPKKGSVSVRTSTRRRRRSATLREPRRGRWCSRTRRRSECCTRSPSLDKLAAASAVRARTSRGWRRAIRRGRRRRRRRRFPACRGNFRRSRSSRAPPGAWRA